MFKTTNFNKELQRSFEPDFPEYTLLSFWLLAKNCSLADKERSQDGLDFWRRERRSSWERTIPQEFWRGDGGGGWAAAGNSDYQLYKSHDNNDLSQKIFLEAKLRVKESSCCMITWRCRRNTMKLLDRLQQSAVQGTLASLKKISDWEDIQRDLGHKVGLWWEDIHCDLGHTTFSDYPGLVTQKEFREMHYRPRQPEDGTSW